MESNLTVISCVASANGGHLISHPGNYELVVIADVIRGLGAHYVELIEVEPEIDR